MDVAIDCMGGDHGPGVTIPAALRFLQDHPEAGVILVGSESAIRRELDSRKISESSRLRIKAATEVVEMHDPPAAALKNKKDSSMRVAINLVKEGEAQACVSAGNTGALMAISRFVLKMLPGIERPAIITILPTLTGQTYMLDMGANVDCSAEHLLQFAVMGSILVSSVEKIPNPKVGLLNVGEEEIKGNEVVKQASELLKSSGLNFIGNVEGDGIYKGDADVVVCDGFVGNVALKTSEGLAHMLATFLRQEYGKNLITRLAGLISLPVINAFKHRVDPRRYNGASLLGLKGIVIKSHGSADAYSFQFALERALDEVKSGMLNEIGMRMQTLNAGEA